LPVKRFILLLALPLTPHFLATVAFAQVQTSPAAASVILARARKATGGDAWNQFSECASEGTITIAGKTGSLHLAENLRTGASVGRADIPDLGVHQANGTSPEGSWQQDNAGDIRLLPSGADWQIDDLYLTSHGYWRPNFGGAKVKLLDPVTDHEVSYDRLQFEVPGGHGFTLWIGQTTHLIERVATDANSVKYLSDYRRVDGVLLPFSQRTGSGDHTQVVTFTKRTLLARVKDSDFAILFAKDFEMPRPGFVTVPAEQGIICEGTINGKGPYKMVFDTGSVNLLSSSVAKELGLSVEGDTQTFAAEGGNVDSKITHVRTLEIGSLIMHDQVFHVIATPSGGEGTPQIAIGYELMRRLVIKIDYEHEELTFYNAAKFKYSGGGVEVPMRIKGLLLEVNGSVDDVPGTFVLDSGNEVAFSLDGGFVKQNNLIERLGAHYHGYSGRGYGGPMPEAYYVRLRTLALGNAEVHDLITNLSAGEPGPGDYAGNIGRSVLRQFNATFDCMRGQLYLEKNAHWDKPEIFNRAGIVIDPTENGEKVMTILPGSPAEAAGLALGDVITKIDGHEPSDDLDDPAFLQPVGTVVRLVVKRGNVDHEIEVTLRDML
jgi:aspartyl protease/PDZ domain-containing protein